MAARQAQGRSAGATPPRSSSARSTAIPIIATGYQSLEEVASSSAKAMYGRRRSHPGQDGGWAEDTDMSGTPWRSGGEPGAEIHVIGRTAPPRPRRIATHSSASSTTSMASPRPRDLELDPESLEDRGAEHVVSAKNVDIFGVHRFPEGKASALVFTSEEPRAIARRRKAPRPAPGAQRLSGGGLSASGTGYRRDGGTDPAGSCSQHRLQGHLHGRRALRRAQWRIRTGRAGRGRQRARRPPGLLRRLDQARPTDHRHQPRVQRGHRRLPPGRSPEPRPTPGPAPTPIPSSNRGVRVLSYPSGSSSRSPRQRGEPKGRPARNSPALRRCSPSSASSALYCVNLEGSR